MDTTFVLLAAGFGSRISEITDKPKSLLEINGKSILRHHLDSWKELGVKNVNIVVGYKKELLIEACREYEDHFNLNFIFNNDFRNCGNTFSLFSGIKNIDTSCIVFDADLVYEAIILKDFFEDSVGDQVLIGKGSLEDIESTKILIDEARFVRKMVDKRSVTVEELEGFDFTGEAIGILKFSKENTKVLATHAEKFLTKESNLNLNWEYLLNEYVLENDVSIHETDSVKWIEIDTPEDYQDACDIFKG